MAGLSSTQEVLVRLYMLGGPQYRAEMVKAGIATKELAGANASLGKAMDTANKRSFIQNQLLFTARRALFYTTLGAIGLTGEVIKMGFAYNNAMQSARVALETTIKPTSVLTGELQKLFNIAAGTPFQVKDITVAFRQMYIGFKPFHVSLDTLNQTILAITNNLSATGKVTPASLQRVSTALTHMANVGHLTGQAVLQLARDGLQLQPALQKELGLTGDQLTNIGKAGIPARDVLMALIKYSQSTPGIANAAFRQANMTLGGSFTSLKDYISQASGTALGGPGGSSGIFGGIQKDIIGVNKQLQAMAVAGKPITLLDIAKAMDKQLSPNTHIIINLFVMFNTAVKTVVISLGLLFKAAQLILLPFDKVASLFGANLAVAKVLGIALGILGTVIIIGTGLWATYRGVADTVKLALYGVRGAIFAVTAAMKIQDILLGGANGVGLLGKWKQWANAKKVIQAADISPGGVVRAPGYAKDADEVVNAQRGPAGFFSRPIIQATEYIAATKFGTAIGRIASVFKAGGLRLGIQQLSTELGVLVAGLLESASAAWVAVAGFVALNIEWIWIPIVIGLIILGLILLYRKWQWFHDLVNNSAKIMGKYWQIFVFAIPIIGQVILVTVELVKHWQVVADIFNTVVGAIKSVIHWFGRIPSHIPFLSSVLGAVGSAAHWLTTSNVHATRAAGGFVFGGGNVLVGEKGPEIVNLPGGSNVIPNNRLGSVQSLGLGGQNGNNGQPIVVQVMLDRKVLAEGVARANQDYAARR